MSLYGNLPILIPSKDLTCPVAIVIAAALVNPAITGTEIKSIKKPEKNRFLKKFIKDYFAFSQRGLFGFQEASKLNLTHFF